MKTSLEFRACFKTELSLSISQAGKKMGAKIILVPKVPVELAPVLEMKLEGPVQLMWIHRGCVLLRGRPPITAHLWGFGCADDCIMSRMDIQLCNSPGETNVTPLVDEMDLTRGFCKNHNRN